MEKDRWVWNLNHVYKPLQRLERDINLAIKTEIYEILKNKVLGKKLRVKISNLTIFNKKLSTLEFDVYIKIGGRYQFLLSGLKGQIFVRKIHEGLLQQDVRQDLKVVYKLLEDFNNGTL